MKPIYGLIVIALAGSAIAYSSRETSLLDRECRWFGKWATYAEQRAHSADSSLESSSSAGHAQLASALQAESRNVFSFEEPRVARFEGEMKRTYAREAAVELRFADALAKNDVEALSVARDDKATIARERLMILASWNVDCAH